LQQHAKTTSKLYGVCFVSLSLFVVHCNSLQDTCSNTQTQQINIVTCVVSLSVRMALVCASLDSDAYTQIFIYVYMCI